MIWNDPLHPLKSIFRAHWIFPFESPSKSSSESPSESRIVPRQRSPKPEILWNSSNASSKSPKRYSFMKRLVREKREMLLPMLRPWLTCVCVILKVSNLGILFANSSINWIQLFAKFSRWTACAYSADWNSYRNSSCNSYWDTETHIQNHPNRNQRD